MARDPRDPRESRELLRVAAVDVLAFFPFALTPSWLTGIAGIAEIGRAHV